MYPFILKLIEIFKVRKESFKAIKNIRKKLKKISDDVAYVYEIERNLFEELNKHVDALIRVNAEYINYYDENDKISIKDSNVISIGNSILHFCGAASHKAYLDILPYVQNEQGYLKRLKQVLTEILNKEKPQQLWSNVFKYLVDFLIDLRYDIELFYHLLHLLKENGFLGETIEIRNKNIAIIKNNLIVSIESKDFNQARYWINHPKNRKWFDKEEIGILNNLVFFIEQQDAYQLEHVIESESFKKIFDGKEAEFFKKILEDIKKNTKSEPYPIAPQELAKDLAEEEKSLEQLKEVAEELKAPPWVNESIDREAERIDDMEFTLGETFPKVEEIQEVKKIKKSRLRLRARLRLGRIKLKRVYKRNKREVLNYGLSVLNESVNLKNKLIDFIKLKLAKEKKELEVLEQKAFDLVKNQYEALDLKPFKINGRRIWIPRKDEVYETIEKESLRVTQLKERISKSIGALASGQYKKVREFQIRVNEYIISTFQGINDSKKILAENLDKIGLKRKSQKFLMSMMLVPILLGGFPQKVSTAFLRPKSPEKILRQIDLDIKEPETQKMLQASAFVDKLIDIINKNSIGNIKNENLPDYIKELISDGILDIAIFVGAEFESSVPISKSEIRILPKNNLILHLRYVDNIKDAKKALEESDVIHVGTHSRYGLGWALAKEGMANPLRMQPSPIKIPKKELYGYKGPILKDLGKEVIVLASDEDIKQIKPRKGYQLISMASCSSQQHFLEVIKRLRQGLPTTVIYTTEAVYGASTKIADIILEGLASGKGIEQMTKEMNNEDNRLRRKWGHRLGDPYQSIVLNTEAGSAESIAYDKHNIPNSLTLFYDIEL